jgi:aminomethyltransferase
MSDTVLSRTPLFDRHAALGARTGGFAGWEMPLQYTTPRAEHTAVRERLGVFDVSHMGQIEVAGPGAAAALARVLTNDLDRLPVGGGQYTLMCADDGGVIDDLIAYRLDGRYLLVVNAGNVLNCVERLEGLLPGDVEWADRSWEVAMLALQGRAWHEVLAPLAADAAALELDYFGVAEVDVAGVPCLVARTGYTGEPGVEIMCPWDGVVELWDALMAADGAPTPAGLVARDTLRLEMGYPLYGQELSRERTPIEAGLRWACDLEGGRFAGAQVMRAQAEAGTPERLAMFRFTEPGIPRPGQTVVSDGAPVGTVTSGTLSPTLGVGIGMAYLPAALAAPGNPIQIDVRGSAKSAVTARRPLVDTSPKESS